MKEDILQFMERVQQDESLQKKLEEAGRNYTGLQTDEAAFECIVVPIAAQEGYTVSVDDVKAMIQELDLDEMKQVTAGASQGYGAGACVGIGGGWTLSWDMVCWWVGLGGGAMACSGEGQGTGDSKEDMWGRD